MKYATPEDLVKAFKYVFNKSPSKARTGQWSTFVRRNAGWPAMTRCLAGGK